MWRILFGIMLFVSTFVKSQDTLQHNLSHAVPVDARTSESVRLFELRMPFRNQIITSSSEFSYQGQIGNAWNPMVAVDYQKLAPGTMRPLYNEQSDRYKIYSADGVIRSGVFRFIKKMNPKNEINVSVTLFQLAGGSNWIDAPVNDNFIEWFHETTGQPNPFMRLENVFNRGQLLFIDRERNKYEVKEGETFAGTFDVGGARYFDLLKNKNTYLSMSVSSSVSLPLNVMNAHIGLGGMMNVALTKALNHRNSFSSAFGCFIQHNQLVKIKEEKVRFFDNPLTTGYRLMVAHSVDFKNGNRFTTSIELQGILTAPLSIEAKGPISTDWIDPTNEFLGNPYNLEKYPESIGLAHPKSNIDRSSDNLTLGTEYLSLNFSYRFGTLAKGFTISTYLQEDWKFFVANGDGIKLLYGGTNAQDLGAGLKLLMPINKN